MTLQETLERLTVAELKQRCAQLPDVRCGTRKADLVATIGDYLLSDALATHVGRLSELERNAVAEALHNGHGRFNPVAFEAKYGSLPSFFTRDPYDWYSRRSKSKRPSGLELLFYSNEIPTDLAAQLARLVPQPAALQIAGLDDDQLPEFVIPGGGGEPEPLRRVDTEAMVRQDLSAVLGLVAQGGLAVGAKTGLPSAAALGRIDALLLGGDWYAATDDRDIPRWAGGPIRPIRAFAWPLLLQAGGLAKIDGSRLGLTAKGKKALSQPVHEVVSHLYQRWQRKGAPDELRRVDAIKGQTSKGVRLTPPLDRRLVIEDALCACCPVGKWLSVDDLFRQMKVEGYRFEVTGNPWKLYFSELRYGSLGYQGGTGFEILEARYTLAYLFEYLATLGLIDVAYSLPYGARPDHGGLWGTDELEFLSRYDGLRYLRLNDLGAFCLDLSETYTPRLAQRPPLLRIESDLTLALLRPAEPGERLQLEQIATPLSGDRWGLDAEAILTRGADADERGRIRQFIESSLGGDVPLEVSDLLDSVDERATALTDTGPARLIQCRDAALAAMLSSDPATAAQCSRAGERQLCVPEKRLAAFRKGLAALGFVLPEPRS
ncbi:hypothetical protein [Thiococcus pfennigii]|uniref:hypothetical protein n=1 Tax=Thiococcus pfennigii TaxID=1057 RepID=UPI001904D201|nr:hypothetical protein [Thiococcus pfennigii]MBK1732158.1 hypothetical protein [Thiococcus pfennigii]